MRKRRIWLALSFVFLAGLIVAVVAPGVAQADVWTDIRDSQWVANYGVTATQVDSVADGYQDGTFRPSVMVTRGQFAKMAVLGLSVPTTTPSSPSFTDVLKSNIFYGYIESAVAADLVEGLGGGKFGPNHKITREQAATILARYLSAVELKDLGHIAGASGAQYASLSDWFAAEGSSYLASYSDSGSIAVAHQPGLAYLVARHITEGSGGKLSPTSDITRAQSAVMILRVVAKAAELGQGSTPQAAPTISGLSPNTGSPSGGDTVTITGTNFVSGATVVFGSVTLAGSSVTVNSSTQMTVVSPAGTAGATVEVRVITSAGTSGESSADEFTYVANVPTITAVSPGAGNPAGGDSVTITGTNFNAGTTVKFGSTAVDQAYITLNSSTRITVITPAGTDGSTVHVTATNPSGTSSQTAADYFSYGVPRVTALSPSSGDPLGGNSVYISGTGFTGSLTVYFGTVALPSAAVTVVSPTQLTVLSPGGAAGSTVDVSVKNAYGTSVNTTADNFSFSAGGPVITSLSLASGDPDGGQTLVITGTGFTNAATVAFGGVTLDALDFTVNTNTQITVTTPQGIDGTTVAITVTTTAGTSAAKAFTYTEQNLPTITSLTPSNGDPSGGGTVTITGTSFTPGSVVNINGVPVASSKVTVVDPTDITFLVPAGTPGTTVVVTVTTRLGTSNSYGYTYVGGGGT